MTLGTLVHMYAYVRVYHYVCPSLETIKSSTKSNLQCSQSKFRTKRARIRFRVQFQTPAFKLGQMHVRFKLKQCKTNWKNKFSTAEAYFLSQKRFVIE